jgi:hypothetical protein
LIAGFELPTGLGRRFDLLASPGAFWVEPDVPRGKLCLDPALPDWLPEVKLTDLRFGASL